MKNISKKTWISIALTVAILLLFVSVWIGISNFDFSRYFQGNNNVTPEYATSLVIRYIDENFIRGATPIELIEVIEQSGVYRIKLRIDEMEFDTYATKDGKLFFPEGMAFAGDETTVIEETTIGGFISSEENICLENGKPIIYYFGRSDCPFCVWQQPVITEAMQPFEGYAVFKDNTDTDNDMDVFSRYNERGGVPLIVVGCRYFRIGAGGQSPEDAKIDRDVIKALACSLTGGQPQKVCQGLNHLIEQL